MGNNSLLYVSEKKTPKTITLRKLKKQIEAGEFQAAFYRDIQVIGYEIADADLEWKDVVVRGGRSEEDKDKIVFLEYMFNSSRTTHRLLSNGMVHFYTGSLVYKLRRVIPTTP